MYALFKHVTSPASQEDDNVADEESRPGAGDNILNAAATLATSPGQLQESDLKSLLPSGVRMIDPAVIEIGDFIARGGFAEVYKGVWIHNICGRTLALRAIAAKRFDAFASLNTETKTMFLKEV